MLLTLVRLATITSIPLYLLFMTGILLWYIVESKTLGKYNFFSLCEDNTKLAYSITLAKIVVEAEYYCRHVVN